MNKEILELVEEKELDEKEKELDEKEKKLEDNTSDLIKDEPNDLIEDLDE